MPIPSLSPARLCLILLLFALPGCSSISKGVAEAVLEQKTEDTRQCRIEGPPFDGIRQSFAAGTPAAPVITKVLMVHGIGPHLPGYSNRFREKITTALGLSITDASFKTIQIAAPEPPGKPSPHLGELSITRHTNETGDRVLLFYELTWANITSPQKEQIAYDSENTDGLKRAGINNLLKSFVNKTVPDMLIYMGAGQQTITSAVKEATCWMLGDRWEDLPDSGAHVCKTWPKTTFSTLSADKAFFITHSLGSLITIDTIQSFARQMALDRHDPMVRDIRAILRDKPFTVFMLSNQLPLLQLGRSPQVATNRLEDFCGPAAPQKRARIIGQLNVIAFSDPNDILSYPVREHFARDNIDSRICTNLVNVSLNVAQEKGLFGATTFADPLTAHSGYLEDERVISLIIDGIQRQPPGQDRASKCQWQEIRRF